MSAEDWLRAVKAEESRLLDEIAKTDLYKQLEAVRAVLTVYPETTASPPLQPGAMTSPRGNGATTERSFKVANAFTEMTEAMTDASARPR